MVSLGRAEYDEEAHEEAESTPRRAVQQHGVFLVRGFANGRSSSGMRGGEAWKGFNRRRAG